LGLGPVEDRIFIDTIQCGHGHGDKSLSGFD